MSGNEAQRVREQGSHTSALPMHSNSCRASVQHSTQGYKEELKAGNSSAFPRGGEHSAAVVQIHQNGSRGKEQNGRNPPSPPCAISLLTGGPEWDMVITQLSLWGRGQSSHQARAATRPGQCWGAPGVLLSRESHQEGGEAVSWFTPCT